MTDTLSTLDALGQAELLGRGEVSALELVDAAIGRIERLDRQLNAVILPAFERARREARELGAQRPSAEHPFLGVPFLMKDLGGAEADAPYHAGMRLLKEAGYRESRDSYLVSHLRRAGFISLGRTNTPELGLLPTTEPEAFGATRNPWSLEHSSGGSSGGSAAAVASGMVAAAHASDGGGSIRIPASHCGLVGLKPTRGRCSFGPALGERWGGFSCELVVTHSVRDTAAILTALAGPMPGDPYSAAPPTRDFTREMGADPGRLRIGVLTGAPREGLTVHPACSEGVRMAARTLEGLGHIVEESHPEAYGDIEAVGSYVAVVACNTARAVETASRRVGRKAQAKDMESLTWALAESGWQTSAPQYLAALEIVHALGRRTAAWWEQGFDLLVTPTAAEPPPRLGEIVSTSEEPVRGFLRAAPFGAFTSLFNQTGQPAISLPLQQTEDGLPVGVQLVAACGGEDLLLRVASQVEGALPWSERRPALFA
jgi:amidase